MNALSHLIFVYLATTWASVYGDIGEKIRLGLPITPPASARNQQISGLETPIKDDPPSAGQRKFIVAVPHNTAQEFTLEKLCNDPFHSFLCTPTVPRKRRIDGNLRPGASLPQGFAKSNSGIVSPTNLETANSDNVAQVGYSYGKPKEQFLTPDQSAQNNVFTGNAQTNIPISRPSNEYLPSFGSPKPQGTYNYPFSLPLLPTKSSTTTTIAPPTTTARQTTTTARAFLGSPSSQVFDTKLKSTPGRVEPILSQFNSGYEYVKPQTPLNVPSATNQIVSSISAGKPANDYLPPKDSLSPRPSDNVQFQVPFEVDDVKTAPQNVNLVRTGSGSIGITTDKPAKKERTHTLEELCKDAFHSFLCKPIDKPRRRIDGKIRPGANIPPHALLSAGSNAQTFKQLPPNQSGGAVSDDSLKGYNYEKPSGKEFQTTNLSPQYVARPNFAQPLYSYQQALLNSAPSNAQPAIASAPVSHSTSSVPCTCHQASQLQSAAQNLAPTAVTGYTYAKPSTSFTLPTSPRPTGYTYPKPSGQPFTLPSRPSTTTEPSLGQQSVSDSIENNALPPSSQFEILKL